MPKNLKLYLVSCLFSVDLKDQLSFISPFVQHFLPLIRFLCFLLISSSTTFSTLAFSLHLSLFTFVPVTDHSSTLNYISKNVSPCIFAKNITVPLLSLCFMNFSPYNKYNSIAVWFYFTDIPPPELKFFFNILSYVYSINDENLFSKLDRSNFLNGSIKTCEMHSFNKALITLKKVKSNVS